MNDDTRWNSSKIISRMISLGTWLSADPSMMTAAVAEAVKKWDGGRSPSGEVWEGLPSFGGLGCYPREIFFENIGANLCNLVHFGDIR